MFCTLKPGGRVSTRATRSTTFVFPSSLMISDLSTLSGSRSCPRSGCEAASTTLSTGASTSDVMVTSHPLPVLTTLEVAISLAGEHEGSVLPHPANTKTPIVSSAATIRMVGLLSPSLSQRLGSRDEHPHHRADDAERVPPGIEVAHPL